MLLKGLDGEKHDAVTVNEFILLDNRVLSRMETSFVFKQEEEEGDHTQPGKYNKKAPNQEITKESVSNKLQCHLNGHSSC